MLDFIKVEKVIISDFKNVRVISKLFSSDVNVRISRQDLVGNSVSFQDDGKTLHFKRDDERTEISSEINKEEKRDGDDPVVNISLEVEFEAKNCLKVSYKTYYRH